MKTSWHVETFIGEGFGGISAFGGPHVVVSVWWTSLMLSFGGLFDG